MSDQIDIPLTSAIPDTGIDQIRLFRMRFAQIWSNWESLKSLGIKLGGDFQNKGGGKVTGPGCGIDQHRLKGFYLDFRFFFADKEPTQFFKILNLIRNHCDDCRLHRVIDQNRREWQDAGVLGSLHGYSADELIRLLFNGSFFHSDGKLQKGLEELESLMNDELAHHLLTFSIYNRMLVIRNLNWVIQPLSTEKQYVRIPEDFV
jgi:hypothetical protein